MAPSARPTCRRTSKKAYTAKLKKLPDFPTLGYIYSDWAKDGFDGKQLTVTTYIQSVPTTAEFCMRCSSSLPFPPGPRT